jgi:hypothetical protein
MPKGMRLRFDTCEVDASKCERVPARSVSQCQAEVEISLQAEHNRAVFERLEEDLAIEAFRPGLTTPGLGSFRTKL